MFEYKTWKLYTSVEWLIDLHTFQKIDMLNFSCIISTKVLTTYFALVAAIILLCSLCCFRKVYVEKMMNPFFHALSGCLFL